MTATTKSDSFETLITSVDADIVSDERRLPVHGDDRVAIEMNSPCKQEAGHARLSDPCSDKGGISVMTGCLFGGNLARQEFNGMYSSPTWRRAAMEIILQRLR